MRYFDDLVTEPNPDALKKAQEWLRTFKLAEPTFTHGGSYRNRFGELVTWEATEDGTCVRIHTWPEGG